MKNFKDFQSSINEAPVGSYKDQATNKAEDERLAAALAAKQAQEKETLAKKQAAEKEKLHKEDKEVEDYEVKKYVNSKGDTVSRKVHPRKIVDREGKEEMKEHNEMLGFLDYLEEELSGKQKKLDKNNNGKLDSQDFKMLRKEATSNTGDSEPAPKKGKDLDSCSCSMNNEDAEQVDEASMVGMPFTAAEKARLDKKVTPSDVQVSLKDLPKDKPLGKRRFKQYVMPGSKLKEEADQIQEESIGDHDKLRAYADKRGGMDKKDLHTAANHMESGDTAALKQHLSKMDTDPRDKVLDHVNKAHWGKLGYKSVHEDEQIDELNRNTLASYAGKAAGDMFVKGSKAEAITRGRNITAALAVGRKADVRQAGITRAAKNLANPSYGVKKEEVELEEEFINGREYASHGLMHPKHAGLPMHKVTGHEVDFYAHGSGDKIQGKVTMNNGKHVHIRASKSSGGGLHKFKVTPHLPKEANEEVEIQERELSTAEMNKREEVVKSMKKSYKDFKDRYGSRAKEVMYATATNVAKKSK